MCRFSERGAEASAEATKTSGTEEEGYSKQSTPHSHEGQLPAKKKRRKRK